MRKVRITPYVDRNTRDEVKVYAKRLGISESEVVEGALNKFMAPDNPEEREKAILRKFDALNRTVKGMKRDHEITSELLSNFIRLYLSCTPEVPDSQKATALRTGGARFQKFRQVIIDRLRDNKLFSEELLQEITAVEDGFEEMEIAVEEEVPEHVG